MFSLVSVVGVITGFGMFGGLAMLPLYLQIVRGATPTESGLLLLPLTGGIMVGSIISGQLISRTGRYKVFPVIGTALMVVGMYLLHTVGADTPFWRTAVFTVVFGLGLGNVMQPITLAVQNAVPPQEIGVATSSVTFFRQMGATVGTAVFLSILFSTVGTNIGSALTDASRTTSFRAALADPAVKADPANASILDLLQGKGSGGGLSSTLDDTSFLQQADERLARPFFVGFSESMDHIFLIGSIVLVAAFLLLLTMREIPLRTSAGISAPDGPQDGATGGRSDGAAVGRAAAGQVAAAPVGPEVAAPPAATAPVGPEVEVPHGPRHAGARPVVVGVVRRASGRPVVDAVLTLADPAGGQVDRARSGADGSFTVVPPAAGSWLLVASAEAFHPAASMVTVDGQTLTRDVTLTGAGRLDGTVSLLHDGSPAPGALVTLADPSGRVAGTARADGAGRFSLAGLDAGEHVLTARADGAAATSVPVTVADETVTRVDVALLASGGLSGVVRAASSGSAVAEAFVTLLDTRGQVVRTAVTAGDGSYRLGDVAPGEYTVVASGYAPVAQPVRVHGGPDDRRDVALGVRQPDEAPGRQPDHLSDDPSDGLPGGTGPEPDAGREPLRTPALNGSRQA